MNQTYIIESQKVDDAVKIISSDSNLFKTLLNLLYGADVKMESFDMSNSAYTRLLKNLDNSGRRHDTIKTFYKLTSGQVKSLAEVMTQVCDLLDDAESTDSVDLDDLDIVNHADVMRPAIFGLQSKVEANFGGITQEWHLPSLPATSLQMPTFTPLSIPYADREVPGDLQDVYNVSKVMFEKEQKDFESREKPQPKLIDPDCTVFTVSKTLAPDSFKKSPFKGTDVLIIDQQDPKDNGIYSLTECTGRLPPSPTELKPTKATPTYVLVHYGLKDLPMVYKRLPDNTYVEVTDDTDLPAKEISSTGTQEYASTKEKEEQTKDVEETEELDDTNADGTDRVVMLVRFKGDEKAQCITHTFKDTDVADIRKEMEASFPEFTVEYLCLIPLNDVDFDLLKKIIKSKMTSGEMTRDRLHKIIRKVKSLCNSDSEDETESRELKLVRDFVAKCCTFDEKSKVKSSDLYSAFTKYSVCMSTAPITQHSFTPLFKKVVGQTGEVFVKRREKDGFYWSNLRVDNAGGVFSSSMFSNMGVVFPFDQKTSNKRVFDMRGQPLTVSQRPNLIDLV